MSRKRKNSFIFWLLLIFLILIINYLHGQPKWPLTRAEQTNYQATSRHEDVLAFIQALQKQSSLIRVENLAFSTEGRPIPLLIIGHPVPVSPRELRFDSRLVVYIQANIHGGEVEGKEASLMLARDLLSAEKPPYLDRLIILITPNFNPDGNEKISPQNRRNQPGPEEGVGIRPNGQNLDLNRDAMKLESPELQGLITNVLERWDPSLFVDCHTTNGSYHEELVTYSWPLNPNGDMSILVYLRDKMLPSIKQTLEKKYKTLAIPYGDPVDFKEMEKGWRTFSHLPRYLTNYIGLRNRLSILDENYVYAPFKDRVMACYNFLRAILDETYSRAEEIKRLVTEADRKTIATGLNPTDKDLFAVEFDLKPLPQPILIKGYEMEIIPREGGFPQIKPTEKKKTYTVPYLADFIPKRSVRLPYAYLITVNDLEIINKIRQHGIIVERLTQGVRLEVEIFELKELKAAERPFQGHRLNTLKGEFRTETRDFPAGTFLVTTAQPLGRLVAYLLEPESDDGLFVWNFFDRYLVPEWGRRFETFPVAKLMKPQPLVKEVWR
ncbi:MAG: M14 family metallopeptidase [Candidatus Aminicenantes bacterium]|nr:M14 family metallopeptidase [Candidatus Aminicenantes bacterium]